jgi:hypothetical protein
MFGNADGWFPSLVQAFFSLNPMFTIEEEQSWEK